MAFLPGSTISSLQNKTNQNIFRTCTCYAKPAIMSARELSSFVIPVKTVTFLFVFVFLLLFFCTGDEQFPLAVNKVYNIHLHCGLAVLLTVRLNWTYCCSDFFVCFEVVFGELVLCFAQISDGF